jgi:hypothetical protein
MGDVDLELQHRLQAREQSLGDAGFSDSVLRQLPARRRQLGTGARRWTLAGAAGMGSLLTILLAEPMEKLLAALAPVPAHAVTIAVLILMISVPLAWIFHGTYRSSGQSSALSAQIATSSSILRSALKTLRGTFTRGSL